MLASALREVLLGCPGVQSVGHVEIHASQSAVTIATARVGFGPNTPVSDAVAIIASARAAVMREAPDLGDVVIEPEVAAPRTDANPSTDFFVIRGAD